MAEPILLVVTIDTEEDNWAPARERLTVENIRELPRLDRLLTRCGAKATYFTTHAVATTPWAAEIMRGLSESGRAEVGAHLHPWNTPPITDELTLPSTMLANLSVAEQRAKIAVLTEALTRAVGKRPLSFRAGRWGFDSGTAQAVLECGYEVDSSVTPFRSWSADHGPSHIGAPLNAYRIDPRLDHRTPSVDGKLLEVPVSWAYAQRPWSVLKRLNLFLDSPVLRGLGLASIAARLRLLNHIVLSPEIETVPHMLALVRSILTGGVKHLNLTFHSSTLLAGLGPFAATQSDVERFYGRLESVINEIQTVTPVQFATVGDAARQLVKPHV